MDKQMSIQEVSDRIGLPKSTLRYWEKELSQYISPMRTPGGQRRYSIDHIQMFKKVQMLKRQGKKIVEIKQVFEQQNNTKADYSASSNGSVEILTQRIAELISKEVSCFLHNYERHVDR
jgi:DNA-binding transcriptional MerR regulator